MSDYKIGIEIAMAGNVEKFLGLMSQHLFGIHGQVKEIEKSIGTWGKLIGGLGSAFLGVEMIKGVAHLAEHGKELNHQQSMMLRNGIAYRDVVAETSKIYQTYTRQVPTASGPDFLRAANELVSVKGTLTGADEALVQSLKIEGLISNSTGKSAEGQGYAFWRTVEDKGIIQNKQLTDLWLDTLTKGTMVTGGKIGGTDYNSYAQKAKTSWVGDALESFPMMLMQMQTHGAATAGVERRMLARMVEGGQKLTKKQIAAFREIGGLDSKGRVLDRDLEVTRPDLFMQKEIDRLNKAGITSLEDVKAWSARALNASSADYFMTAWAGMTEIDPQTGKTRLQKEQDNVGRPGGLNKSYDTMMKTDYGANMEALNKQWNSFIEAAGGPLAKAAIPALQAVTSAINQLGAAAQAHPEMATIAGEATLVAGGLATIAGSVVALSAALKIGGWAMNKPGAVGPKLPAPGEPSFVGPNMPKFNVGKFAKSGLKGGIIAGLLEYLGEGAIDAGTDYFKTSPYPAGYDPAKQRDMGITDRLKAIWQEMPDFISKAHAEPANPYGGLVNPFKQQGADASAKASMMQIGDQMRGAVAALPAQVNPAITSAFGQIGAALSSAISGLAGAAAAAAAGSTHVELKVRGEDLAVIVNRHNNRMIGRARTTSWGADGRAHWIHPELAINGA